MSQPPNNSLQTTADGAFNLTIESLVFKCRSSAVFEVGRSFDKRLTSCRGTSEKCGFELKGMAGVGGCLAPGKGG